MAQLHRTSRKPVQKKGICRLHRITSLIAVLNISPELRLDLAPRSGRYWGGSRSQAFLQ